MRTTCLALLAVAAACAPRDRDPNATDTAGAVATATPVAAPESGPGAPAAAAVTDPQIAAIVVAANTVDIDAGRLAESRAASPAVKEFGRRMAADHAGVNKAATALVAKLGVTPEENATSRQLTEGGKRSRDSLSAKSGAEFDRAYIANEVAYHQAVLDALDKTLLPGAQNAELRKLLEQTRPAFVSHLKYAQTVQSSLAAP